MDLRERLRISLRDLKRVRLSCKKYRDTFRPYMRQRGRIGLSQISIHGLNIAEAETSNGCLLESQFHIDELTV
jgi:hypothetical protein